MTNRSVVDCDEVCVTSHLVSALSCVRTTEWQLAATILVRAWHIKKLPTLAELIETLDRKTTVPEIEGASIGQREAAWLEISKEPSEESVQRLLATPWPTTPRVAMTRIAALVARGPSPRVSQALVALHSRAQYPSAAGRRLSRYIFRLLMEQLDPIVTAYFARFDGHETHEAEGMRRTLRSLEKRKRIPIPQVSEDEARLLAELVRDLTSKPRSVERSLRDAIYAAPFDDGPRIVLADYLTELGDPRGEFIALQLSNSPTSKRRIQSLIRHAGKTWWDGLDVDGAVVDFFERGFPVSVRAELLTFDAPAWATIEYLSIGSLASPTIRGSRALHALRVLEDLPTELLGSFVMDKPAQLEGLILRGEGALDTTTELSPLAIGFSKVSAGAALSMATELVTHPLGRRVERLALGLEIDDLAIAVSAFASPLTSVGLVTQRASEYRLHCWLAELTHDTLLFEWRGEGDPRGEFKRIERVIRELQRPPAVRMVEIAGESRFASEHFPALVRTLEPLVRSWSGSPQVVAKAG